MRRNALGLLVLVWLAAVASGVHILSQYEFAPGPAGAMSADWPATTPLQRTPNTASLIVFAHPQCPCTRASLAELARILAQATVPVKTWVLFVQPRGEPDGWVHTDLWRQASALPGVTVLADAQARQARCFHALTSGQAVLYDPQGRLRFQGGLTDSRGHEGDNPGQAAVLALLQGRRPERSRWHVFGCALFTPGEAIAGGGRS